MRWDAARMQKKTLGSAWLLWPLCLTGHPSGAAAGLFLLLWLHGRRLPPSRYGYPRKQGGAAERIFFSAALCFFLMALLQQLLLFAGRFFFSISPLYRFLSLSIALFFALPMAARALFLRFRGGRGFWLGGALMLLGFFIAGRS